LVSGNYTSHIFRNQNGNKVNYTGQMAQGLADGFGAGHYFELNIPYVYTGDWIEGKAIGQGKAVYDNGNSYSGQWNNGLMNGQGTNIIRNVGTYEGNPKPFNLAFCLWPWNDNYVPSRDPSPTTTICNVCPIGTLSHWDSFVGASAHTLIGPLTSQLT
jgi:hypothetical protein